MSNTESDQVASRAYELLGVKVYGPNDSTSSHIALIEAENDEQALQLAPRHAHHHIHRFDRYELRAIRTVRTLTFDEMFQGGCTPLRRHAQEAVVSEG